MSVFILTVPVAVQVLMLRPLKHSTPMLWPRNKSLLAGTPCSCSRLRVDIHRPCFLVFRGARTEQRRKTTGIESNYFRQASENLQQRVSEWSITTRYIYIQGHVILAWIDNKKCTWSKHQRLKRMYPVLFFLCTTTWERFLLLEYIRRQTLHAGRNLSWKVANNRLGKSSVVSFTSKLAPVVLLIFSGRR